MLVPICPDDGTKEALGNREGVTTCAVDLLHGVARRRLTLALPTRHRLSMRHYLVSVAAGYLDGCPKLIDQQLSQVGAQRHEPDLTGVGAELEQDERSRGVCVPAVRYTYTDHPVALTHAHEIHF